MGRKVHWKTWNHLQEPKERGGMGFRNLVSFNKTLLAKKLWRILNEPNNVVAKVLKAR